MDLAVRTTASPAAIWAIVVVAVVFLAFWLIMVMVYATRPDPRHRRLPARVPAQRGAEAPTEPIPAQSVAPAGAEPVGTAPPGGSEAPVV